MVPALLEGFLKLRRRPSKASSIQKVTQRPCRHCRKPATSVCGHCNGIPIYETFDEAEETYYCSERCSTLDKPKHVRLCESLQERRAFFRAAELLQEMFYLYRERLFDRRITRVDRFGEDLYIHESRADDEDLSYLDLTTFFPSGLVFNVHDKQAILALEASNYAVGWMYTALHYYLKHLGLVSNTREVHVYTKNDKRRLVVSGRLIVNGCNFDPKPCIPKRHRHILQVTLKNGEIYALDLTGAESGYYEPVTSMKIYTETRIDSESPITMRHFGSLVVEIGDRSAELGGKHYDLANIMYRYAAMDVTAREWVAQNVPLGDMLRLPQAKFEKAQREIVGLYKFRLDDGIRASAREIAGDIEGTDE